MKLLLSNMFLSVFCRLYSLLRQWPKYWEDKILLTSSSFFPRKQNQCTLERMYRSDSPCIMSVQYTWGCSVHWGDIMSTLGISWVRWGISWVHWGMFSTLGFPHKFNCFSNDLPLHLSWYPLCTLDIPQCTEHPQCARDIPHFTHDILQCTEHPPLYCTPPDVLHRHYAGCDCSPSILQTSMLSPPLEDNVLWCPWIYNEFFLDWMGFDREVKRHFLTAFADKPGLFCGILYLRRSYESRDSVVY